MKKNHQLWRFFFLASFAGALFSQMALSNQLTAKDQYFEKFMALFSAQTKVAMNELPPKFDSSGQPVLDPGYAELIDARGLAVRSEVRDQIIRHAQVPLSEIVGASDFRRFFYSAPVDLVLSPERMQGRLEFIELNQKPWSGDYWATFRGGVGARYADENYPNSFDFMENYSAFEKYQPIDFSNSNNVQNLSASEKYDILVGDEEFGLTKWSFTDALDTYRAGGNKIETWFGICHGWAPAAYMLAKPMKSVSVRISQFQGRDFDLKFFPDDIKALSSLLWANGTLQTNFLGSRCDEKAPQQDENGRIIDEACFDLNPGAWHVTLVNQLGVVQSSLVIDATYDYQVWNQPVVSYKYKYFNPQTKKLAGTLAEAMVERNSFTADKFSKYRGNKTKFIVGVKMDLTYTVETTASHSENESEDRVRVVEYVYDLELNERGDIIGGEWYQNAHPDFLWSAVKGARAVSVTDHQLREDWTRNENVPAAWLSSARMASSYGQPLAKIVEGLTRRSQ